MALGVGRRMGGRVSFLRILRLRFPLAWFATTLLGGRCWSTDHFWLGGRGPSLMGEAAPGAKAADALDLEIPADLLWVGVLGLGGGRLLSPTATSALAAAVRPRTVRPGLGLSLVDEFAVAAELARAL